MPTRIVRVRGKKADVIKALKRIPRILSGKEKDSDRLNYVHHAVYARALLEKIHEAFLIKSAGGTDELGTKWKPLKPETIAARPVARGELKKLGITGTRRRGLLTPEQDRIWRGIFASTLKRLVAKGMDLEKAKIKAAKIAWAILKARGALTKLMVLGRRKVAIGIVSGDLERSISPGKLSSNYSYSKPKHQIFEINPSSIRVGSDLIYASRFHHKRRLWPAKAKMGPWQRFAAKKATAALAAYLAARPPVK